MSWVQRPEAVLENRVKISAAGHPIPWRGAEPGQMDRVHVQKTQHGAPGDSERSTPLSLESWACTEEKREPGKGKCGMRQEGLSSQAGAPVI